MVIIVNTTCPDFSNGDDLSITTSWLGGTSFIQIYNDPRYIFKSSLSCASPVHSRSYFKDL